MDSQLLDLELMESEIIKSILLQLDSIKSVLGYVITQTQDPLNNSKINNDNGKECLQELEVIVPVQLVVPDSF